jgi:hemerythrin HHE cation binding domain-containing protein
MSTTDDTFGLLLEQHVALGDLFASHQEALLDRRWAEATWLLEEYDRRLRRHISVEERHLLSRCEKIEAMQWPTDVYRAEHRRIEQLLTKTTQRLASARCHGITPAMLISLLDEERTLKRLVEHHHEREENGLFGELRAGLSVELSCALAKELGAKPPSMLPGSSMGASDSTA